MAKIVLKDDSEIADILTKWYDLQLKLTSLQSWQGLINVLQMIA